MKTPIIASICTLLVSILAVCSCSQKEDHARLVRELNKQIVELPATGPLDYTDAFIGGLLDWDHYSLIGLGEASHGVKDFFELKHRLFRFLVEYHDFKVLAYEFSFRTSLKVNDYVLLGKGDLDSLFAGELWIQDNYEVQDLIQWMQDYNSEREIKDRIHFVGIDNQLDAFYPERSIAWVQGAYPELIEQNRHLVSEIRSLEHINYEGITAGEYEKRKRLFEKLLDRTKDYLQSDAVLASSFNSKVAIHLVEALISSNQWLFNIFTGKENNRDWDMAKNLLWVRDVYHSKIAVWAHNSHLQINPDYYEDGGASMGYHLKSELKESYLVVSTAFTKGSFKAVMDGPDGKDTPPLDCEICEDPPGASFNEIFYQARYGDFFLDISNLQAGSPLYPYLDAERPMLGIGDWFAGSAELHYSSTHRHINLLQSTDVLFYYSNTEPLTLHNRFSH